MQRVPDLFLIGAQKGGSTSLFDSLVRHREIGRYRLKEPKIFSQPTDAAVRARLAEFVAPDGAPRFLLDGTVDHSRYPLYPRVPETIRRFCGAEARFIYILRHPFDRLLSEYFWMQNRYGQPGAIAEVVTEQPQYVQTSLYDVQIRHYLEHFDIERFRFVRFDDFVRDRQAAVRGVFEWLGLDPGLAEPENRQGGRTDRVKTRAPRFGALNGLLWSSPWLRRVVRERLSEQTVRRLARFMTVETPRRDPSEAFRREMMERHFNASIERTAQLTGLDLSVWSEAARARRSEAA